MQEEIQDTVVHATTENIKMSYSLRRTLSFDALEQTEKGNEMNLSAETMDITVSGLVGLNIVIPSFPFTSLWHREM